MIFFAALGGALIYAGLHEWIEYLIRLSEKRKSCPHRDTHVTTTFGYKTLHCRDCGWQEPIQED